MTCNASSNRPGFSYFVGVNDKEINRFRNFCDAESAGGEGILGKFRNDAYEGGVAPKPAELEEVDGRYPGDCGGLTCEAAALRFDDEALSIGDGLAFLDRDRSNSFSLFVLNKPSNCTLKSLAQCSS
jgi:hypothetical protein